MKRNILFSQLRAVDHSARGSKKNAANCVKYGELQGAKKLPTVERILRPWPKCWGHACLRVCFGSIAFFFDKKEKVY